MQDLPEGHGLSSILDLTATDFRADFCPAAIAIMRRVEAFGIRRLTCRVVDLVWKLGHSGFCYATQQWIANKFGVDRNAIREAINEAIDLGMISCENRDGISNKMRVLSGALEVLGALRNEARFRARVRKQFRTRRAAKRAPAENPYSRVESTFFGKNHHKGYPMGNPYGPRIESILLANLANARACAPAREACLLEEEKNDDEVIPVTPLDAQLVCDQPSKTLPTSNQENDVVLDSGALASLVCKDVYSDELDKQPIEIPASGAQRSPKPIAGCARSARTQTLPARPPVSHALPISQELVAQLRALPMAWHGIRDLAAMPDAESRIRQTFALGKHLEPGTKNPAGIFRAACLGNWASEQPLPGSEQAAAMTRERQHDRPQPGTVAHTKAKASYDQLERIEVERRRAEAERAREWRETPEGKAEAERGMSILRETMDRLAGRCSQPTRPLTRTAPSWIGAG